MSKALEALEKFLNDYLTLCEKLHTNRQEKMLLDKNSPYNVLKTYLQFIDNAESSKALEALERIENEYSIDEAVFYKEDFKQVRKSLNALEVIKKHFIIKMSEEAELNGNVWGRLVRIQSKEDEGTWDTTAIANIVDYKEDFDLLKEILDNE